MVPENWKTSNIIQPQSEWVDWTAATNSYWCALPHRLHSAKALHSELPGYHQTLGQWRPRNSKQNKHQPNNASLVFQIYVCLQKPHLRSRMLPPGIHIPSQSIKVETAKWLGQVLQHKRFISLQEIALIIKFLLQLSTPQSPQIRRTAINGTIRQRAVCTQTCVSATKISVRYDFVNTSWLCRNMLALTAGFHLQNFI